jgi:4-carboxymuconolactone decarboxylase
MSPAQIDPESGCRIPLPRREDLDPEGQKAFDFYTSGTLRGLHGPAGIWLHSPKLADLYQPLGTYLRSGAGLDERVREVGVMATAREFNNAFEWAAHEREANDVGVPQEVSTTKASPMADLSPSSSMTGSPLHRRSTG